ncbi:MAG: AIR synthase related protein [Candidatus Bathyarchaeia archaeon]
MDIVDMLKTLRNFEGIERKKHIAGIVQRFQSLKALSAILNFGQDSAILRCPSARLLLFHVDGVIEQFIDLDPRNAGFFGVILSLKDIYVMGGVPLAMVDVISYKNEMIKEEILGGMKEAAEKCRVPIVGGHTHPNAPSNALSIAVIGWVERNVVVDSSHAKANEDIIMAADLEGRRLPKWNLGWDATSMKDMRKICSRWMILRKIAKKRLVTAGKDISNAGVVGTLAMLLEASRVGALINLDNIPKPENIPLVEWLKMHPSYGFIYTARKSKARTCLKIFKGSGIAAEKIGETDNTMKLKVNVEGRILELFDLSKDHIVISSKT